MSVFRNYDPTSSGGVNQNALPRMVPQPWIPSQRNIRQNPAVPSQPQRIQPQERGTFFPTSASAGGTLAPTMSSGCTGCNGCGGNGSKCGGSVDDGGPLPAPTTASSIATGHTFNISGAGGARSNVATLMTTTRPGAIPRKIQGAMRPTPRVSNKPRSGLASPMTGGGRIQWK